MSKVWDVLVLLIGYAVLANALTDEEKELMDSLHKQCVGNVGVSEDLVSKAQKGEFADDEKLKCYMSCQLDELGLFGDDGKIDVEGMIALLPDGIRDQMTPVIKKCAVLVILPAVIWDPE
ncbi:hypothetical protein NQ314_019268 [Rhamnusium bicolor]|uniref:Uncharacterized protein n=1 Tax=Rhamnusium bicolor TaxID=1586634 RepID=A0AAV8WQ20_9CUCU|nr:hypothetical protein NQ314_019268 [Rhamnusium bicolor]